MEICSLLTDFVFVITWTEVLEREVQAVAREPALVPVLEANTDGGLELLDVELEEHVPQPVNVQQGCEVSTLLGVDF